MSGPELAILLVLVSPWSFRRRALFVGIAKGCPAGEVSSWVDCMSRFSPIGRKIA